MSCIPTKYIRPWNVKPGDRLVINGHDFLEVVSIDKTKGHFSNQTRWRLIGPRTWAIGTYYSDQRVTVVREKDWAQHRTKAPVLKEGRNTRRSPK